VKCEEGLLSPAHVVPERQKAAARASKAKSKPLPEPAPLSAYRPIKSETETQDADFLQSLLGGMTAATTQSNPRKRKGSQSFKRPDFSTIRDHDGASSDGPDEFIEQSTFIKKREALSSDDEALTAPSKRFKTEDGTGINISHTTAKVDRLKVEDPYDAFEDEYGPIDLDVDIEPIIKKEESPIPLSKLHATKENNSHNSHLAQKKEEKPELPSWLSVHASLPTVSHDTIGGESNNLISTRVQALEDDGTLRMFWLDYLELDGKVYLVGKILDKAINAYVSACVTVENIERNLFVLPRERVVEDGHETDVQPTQLDVQRDFEDARRQFKIGRCGIKWVKRSYAFGEAGVPTGLTSWMKVVYPFSG
jgi:DNA polymerase alpha subunit A